MFIQLEPYCFRTRKKAGPSSTNTEEGIPIKPIKHKRGGSDHKAKEPANNEPKEKEKGAEKRNQPAAGRQTQPANKKNNNKSTVDLDKG